jgi:hypothetical protein
MNVLAVAIVVLMQRDQHQSLLWKLESFPDRSYANFFSYSHHKTPALRTCLLLNQIPHSPQAQCLLVNTHWRSQLLHAFVRYYYIRVTFAIRELKNKKKLDLQNLFVSKKLQWLDSRFFFLLKQVDFIQDQITCLMGLVLENHHVQCHRVHRRCSSCCLMCLWNHLKFKALLFQVHLCLK